MGPRAFRAALAGIAGLVALSATPFPGALIGFLCATAVAFFLAPLAFLVQALASGVGVELPLGAVIAAGVALYGLAVLAALAKVRPPLMRGEAGAARLAALRAAVLAALPLVAWLSMRALMRAWP